MLVYSGLIFHRIDTLPPNPDPVIYTGLRLFDLILYVPSTIFQLNRDGSSWVEPVLSWDKCVLLKDHNPVTPVRLEPAAPLSRVKHSTTEPLCSLIHRFRITKFLSKKIVNIFFPMRFYICFGRSKEPSHWDGSFEYPQHMFRLRNKNSFWSHTLN